MNPSYPKVLSTLGDHIRKRRLDLELLQGDVASQIGVDKDTIHNWELNKSIPTTRFIPKIYSFLGYAPYKEYSLLCQKIRLWRESMGLSQRELAEQAGVDECGLAAWERGGRKPTPKSIGIIETLFTKWFNYPVKL